jgi:hypothetical protein
MRLLADRLRRLEGRAAERRLMLIPLEREDPETMARIEAEHPSAEIVWVFTGVPRSHWRGE